MPRGRPRQRPTTRVRVRLGQLIALQAMRQPDEQIADVLSRVLTEYIKTRPQQQARIKKMLWVRRKDLHLDAQPTASV